MRKHDSQTRAPGQFPTKGTSPWTDAGHPSTLAPSMPVVPHPPSAQRSLARTAVAVGLTAVAAGAAGAAFLVSLNAVTRLHQRHAWLLFLLPVLGLAVWWLYHRFAGPAAKGTNLLIEQVHEAEPLVPFRLAPLIFASTLLTHLGGGSAGREGTAVQMGGGIGGGVSSLLRLVPVDRRRVLLAGMAAGFGAVFGTPMAAAIFALECTQPRRLDWRALPVCLIASWTAHLTCLACGGSHATYDVGFPPIAGLRWEDLHFDWLLGSAVAGLAAGGIARVYIQAGKLTARGFSRIPQAWLRPMAGAGVVILLATLLRDRSYLGLGALPMDSGGVSIQTSLERSGIPPWAWALKLVFTAVTLGSGFKGGEVTPLFFMGATAGNALAPYVGLPPAMGAALGLAGVFAGASRTPVACTILGVELFGFAALPYLALTCWLSRYTAGHDSIYEAQSVKRSVEQPGRQPEVPSAQ